MLYQAIYFGMTLGWGFLMFSWLHDVQHIEGFWMERNRFLRGWFVGARNRHEVHHVSIGVGSTPVANVKWAGDGANWVSLQGNTATCLQPAPVIVLPAFSTVTASVQASGTVFKAGSGLYCF